VAFASNGRPHLYSKLDDHCITRLGIIVLFRRICSQSLTLGTDFVSMALCYRNDTKEMLIAVASKGDRCRKLAVTGCGHDLALTNTAACGSGSL
jgi:hypothetical protein